MWRVSNPNCQGPRNSLVRFWANLVCSKYLRACFCLDSIHQQHPAYNVYQTSVYHFEIHNPIDGHLWGILVQSFFFRLHRKNLWERLAVQIRKFTTSDPLITQNYQKPTSHIRVPDQIESVYILPSTVYYGLCTLSHVILQIFPACAVALSSLARQPRKKLSRTCDAPSGASPAVGAVVVFHCQNKATKKTLREVGRRRNESILSESFRKLIIHRNDKSDLIDVVSSLNTHNTAVEVTKHPSKSAHFNTHNSFSKPRRALEDRLACEDKQVRQARILVRLSPNTLKHPNKGETVQGGKRKDRENANTKT